MKLRGGCLCGDIRYEFNGELLDAGFCHCRLCQRSSGAPVLAWATGRADGFRYTAGKAQEFRSSAFAVREFCGRCGTQLLFRSKQSPGFIDFTLASLDDPGAVTPQYHIWTSSRIRWLHPQDELPEFTDAGPDIP